jgi:hypothetical protein
MLVQILVGLSEEGFERLLLLLTEGKLMGSG